MRYFLIGVALGIVVGFCATYFVIRKVNEPIVAPNKRIAPGYTMIRFEDEGRWVKLIVNDTGYVYFENGPDTLKLLKQNQ